MDPVSTLVDMFAPYRVDSKLNFSQLFITEIAKVCLKMKEKKIMLPCVNLT